MQFQERAAAVAVNRPVPSLYSSADIRSLKMDDFKYAHEQVPYLVVIIIFLDFSIFDYPLIYLGVYVSVRCRVVNEPNFIEQFANEFS